jgi:hypothetical protein
MTIGESKQKELLEWAIGILNLNRHDRKTWQKSYKDKVFGMSSGKGRYITDFEAIARYIESLKIV